MPSQIHTAEMALTCDSLLDSFPLPQAGEARPSECIIFLLFHQMRGGSLSGPHRTKRTKPDVGPEQIAITTERV